MLLLALNRRPIGKWFVALAFIGLIVNGFGAITFGRHKQFYEEWLIDPDHARPRIGEQHRPAIGGRGRDGDTGTVCHDRIRPGPLTRKWRPHDDRVRREDLVRGDERVGRDAHPCRHAPTIFPHQRLVVVGPRTDVQAVINAGRHAADACKKAMSDP